MQLFILLYIEAGSYINEEEDSWEFVILWVSPFIVPFSMYVLMGIGTKSASGGRRPSQRPIISLDTPRCTPSTAFQTRSGFD